MPLLCTKEGKEETSRRLEKGRLLGEKGLLFRLQSMCSFEIRDFDSLVEKTEVEEVIRCACPEVTNTRMGIIAMNSGDRNSLAWKSMNNIPESSLTTGIKIGWVICRI